MRLARHWLDVVRYADTYGYEWDIPARGAWRYRDYLIRAFNGDVPFDQLVREQVCVDAARHIGRAPLALARLSELPAGAQKDFSLRRLLRSLRENRVRREQQQKEGRRRQ